MTYVSGYIVDCRAKDPTSVYVCVVILINISDLKQLTYHQSKAHQNGTGLYEVCYKI